MAKLRRCLKCGNEFKSSGPHNRKCPICKKIEKKFGGIVEQFIPLPIRKEPRKRDE